MTKELSVVEAFNESFSTVRDRLEEVGRIDKIQYYKQILERQLNGKCFTEFGQIRMLGALAAYNQWIEREKKQEAELEGMYAYHCQQHPDEVPPEDAAKYADWVF